jgi:hypothetical protein
MVYEYEMTVTLLRKILGTKKVRRMPELWDIYVTQNLFIQNI